MAPQRRTVQITQMPVATQIYADFLMILQEFPMNTHTTILDFSQYKSFKSNYKS